MLGPRYDDQVAEENRFHPSMLSNYLKSLKVSNSVKIEVLSNILKLTNPRLIVSFFVCLFLVFLQVKMGLLVDLTNTTRFYDRNEIEKEGVKYVKLQCKGYE